MPKAWPGGSPPRGADDRRGVAGRRRVARIALCAAFDVDGMRCADLVLARTAVARPGGAARPCRRRTSGGGRTGARTGAGATFDDPRPGPRALGKALLADRRDPEDPEPDPGHPAAADRIATWLALPAIDSPSNGQSGESGKAPARNGAPPTQTSAPPSATFTPSTCGARTTSTRAGVRLGFP